MRNRLWPCLSVGMLLIACGGAPDDAESRRGPDIEQVDTAEAAPMSEQDDIEPEREADARSPGDGSRERSSNAL